MAPACSPLVVAVGQYNIAEKIKQAVYPEDNGENSPLFKKKLDHMTTQIRKIGMIVHADWLHSAARQLLICLASRLS